MGSRIPLYTSGLKFLTGLHAVPLFVEVNWFVYWREISAWRHVLGRHCFVNQQLRARPHLGQWIGYTLQVELNRGEGLRTQHWSVKSLGGDWAGWSDNFLLAGLEVLSVVSFPFRPFVYESTHLRSLISYFIAWLSAINSVWHKSTSSIGTCHMWRALFYFIVDFLVFIKL